MIKRISCLFVWLSLLAVSVTEARQIEKLVVSEGYDDTNTLASPVFDASGIILSVSEFTESFDRGELMFRRRSGWARGGLKAKLSPTVKPGTILAQLLEAEAKKMGFTVGDGGWMIGGDVTQIYLENDVPSAWAMGAMLFYGYLEVDLQLTSPEGVTSEHTLGLHSYSVQGGMNGFKSARDGLSVQLIEAAQEVLTRLNKTHFKAPPHATIPGFITQVETRGVENQEHLIHAIGLSGSSRAAPVFLAMLAGERNENYRSHLINALARIGTPEVIERLSERYLGEDDDCRWYTLKTLSYIGTDEALAMVRDKGLKDPEEYYRKVAERILAQAP